MNYNICGDSVNQFHFLYQLNTLLEKWLRPNTLSSISSTTNPVKWCKIIENDISILIPAVIRNILKEAEM